MRISNGEFQKAFDILNVASDVTGLMLKEKKRGTLHSKADYGTYLDELIEDLNPTHSFAVWGKDTGLLEKMDNQESTGKDFPYAYMHERNAKMLLINVPITRSFTFMHYVEQCVDVPYRYHKYFIGKYRNKEGIETIR